MKVKALVVAFFSNSGRGRDRGSRAFASHSDTPYGDSANASSLLRPLKLSMGLLGAALLWLTFLAVSVSASPDGRIADQNEYPAAVLPGGVAALQGLAVSKREGGDIYVTDGSSNQRVDQFEPDGTFVRAFGWGIVPAAATGTGTITAGSPSILNVTTTAGSFSTGYFGVGKIITGSGIPADDVIAKVNSTEIELSKAAEASATGIPLAVAAGPGNVPTNEIQRVAVSASGGEYELTFRSPDPSPIIETTAAIAYDAEASTVQAALESLANIGAGNVAVNGPAGGPYEVEFKGTRYADTNVRRLSPTEVNLTGGTSEVTVTTPQEGAGVLETCTTVCIPSSTEEGTGESGNGGGGGSQPGRMTQSDEIAIDNDSAAGSEYGDVYVVDQRNFRVEKYTSDGKFLLMFGGEVDKTTGADVCTAADLVAGDNCGAGVPGTGPSHFYTEEPPTEAGGFKSWSGQASNSIAVGPGGTVYVGDYGRIQEFEPDGSFAGELVPADAEPLFVSAIAVDAAGNIYERSAILGGEGNALQQASGVREYSPSHALVRTFDTISGSEPTHVALDAGGDVFVSDRNGGDFQFRAFKPDGTLYAVFTSDQAGNAHGIVVGDAAGKLYVTSPFPEGDHIAVIPLPTNGPPTVTEEHVTDIQPTTATLHGVVNPRGFDTEYRFEYVDQESFVHEGGFSSPQTHVTSFVSLGLVNREDPVQTAISGLTTGTVYHYRLVARNHCNEAQPSEVCTTTGVDETFESLPSTSIRNFTTQTVGPELVTIKAELNPNGQSTTYTIHYGKEEGNYNGGTEEGSLPLGNEFKEVTATFSGLQPNTEYHYQLITVSANGEEVETADQTFITEHSSAEDRAAESCPNTNLREENNSITLPDCRAYEKTSHSPKEGGEAFPAYSLSPNGERVVYSSEGVFASAEQNPLAVKYLAQRTSGGWVTSAVVRRLAARPTEPAFSHIFSPELNRWLFRESSGLNLDQSGNAQKTTYYSMGLAEGAAVLHATPTIGPVEAETRFSSEYSEVGGASSDLSHLLIITSSRLLPGPSDPRPDLNSGGEAGPADRIYEISGAGGPNPTISLAAEVPLGLTATGGAFEGGGGCFINNPNTIGRELNSTPRLINEDGATIFYTAPIEKTAGTKCGAGNPNPIGIFARTGEAAPVQLNAPFQCTSGHSCDSATPATPLYDGASADGSRVWFTTTQPLVNADTDTTNDLYVAKLEPDGQLAELVLASAGQATTTHPTPGSGANVGEEGVESGSASTNQGVVRVSNDGSHAAFESPAVLTTQENALHQSPVKGANNLYVYDAQSGETKFVTELCSGPGLSGTEKAGSAPQNGHAITKANAVADPACPATVDPYVDPFLASEGNDDILWLPGNGGPAAFTTNGNDLLFASWGRLAPGDTDNVRDIYRYDFSTGQLLRVSVGRNGNDGNGNDDAYPAEFPNSTGGGAENFSETNQLSENSIRSISADGSTVIFRTAAPLVSHDTNSGAHPACLEPEPNVAATGCDIYEWEEQGHGTCHEVGGCVSLISDGVEPRGTNIAVIGSSGRDISFHTLRNLIPEDTDGVGDVYDARVEGGFHAPHEPPQCLSPEACRSSSRAEPPIPTFGTEVIVGPGNSATHRQCAKGRRRVIRHGQVRCVAKHHKKKHQKKHHKAKHKRRGANRGGAR